MLIAHNLVVVAEMADEVAVMYTARTVEKTDSINLFDARPGSTLKVIAGIGGTKFKIQDGMHSQKNLCWSDGID